MQASIEVIAKWFVMGIILKLWFRMVGAGSKVGNNLGDYPAKTWGFGPCWAPVLPTSTY